MLLLDALERKGELFACQGFESRARMAAGFDERLSVKPGRAAGTKGRSGKP